MSDKKIVLKNLICAYYEALFSYLVKLMTLWIKWDKNIPNKKVGYETTYSKMSVSGLVSECLTCLFRGFCCFFFSHLSPHDDLDTIVKTMLLLLLSRFSRVRLCATPIDGSPPGSAFPGILQARTLEWVAISFSNAWKV